MIWLKNSHRALMKVFHQKNKHTRYEEPLNRLNRQLNHYPKSMEEKKRLRCRVCVRHEKHMKTTKYLCESCEVPLCLEPCFSLYHTKKNF